MTDLAGPTDAPRVIRVFVSSTFRDMQAEREELVKRVFPAIRHRCAQRGVAFAEIDLRWGVTDEQKAEGAVLPICLREIELSRPYFIGLLGDRYGWVPDEIPAELAVRLGWLTEDAGRSVTEMEILHGVLNDTEMQSRAFFYLRDPRWATQLAPEERADFVDDDPVLGERLGQLKDRIRGSGLPVQDYEDPAALGRLVSADLDALLDELFPESAEVADPLDAQRAEHAAYAATRFDGYLARPSDVAALDAHLAGEGPPLVVTGESGSGKSALVANWLRATCAADPALAVIDHYAGASAASTEWTVVAARIIGELGRLLGRTLEAPADPAALQVALARALFEAGTAQRVLLLLDGVDQVEVPEGRVALFWLPEQLPAGVRLVLSAKPGAAADELARRGWPTHSIGPLTAEERRSLVESFLGQYAKALDAEHVDRLLAAPQTANPLYLLALLDELRQHGDHFTLGAVIEGHLSAVEVDDLYERILARYERDYERDRPGLVGEAFSLIWAARRGLTEAELLALLGDPATGEPLPRAVWSPLFLAAERSLVTRSGTVGFFHDYLRKAVRDRYLPDDRTRAAAHARLAARFAAMPLEPRVLEELTFQQAAAGQWDALAETLGRADFLVAAYRANRFDLRSIWTRLEAASHHRMPEVYAPLLSDPSADPDSTWALARLLGDAGHSDAALALHPLILEDARAAGNDARLQAALLNHGAALVALDDLEGAGSAFAEAEVIARKLDRPDLIDRSISNRAIVFRHQRRFDLALPLLAEAEAIGRATGDLASLQATISERGSVANDQGDFATAMAAFAEQEQLCRQIGDPELIGNALGAQATVLSTWGRDAEAQQRYDEWAACCRLLGDQAGLQTMLGNRAVDLLTQGRLDDAAALSTEAAEICRRIGSRSGLARTLLIDGMIRHRRGDLAGALEVLGRHEQACNELDDRNGMALGYGERATILREQGDLDGALGLHIEEERIYREIHSATGVVASLANQANVHLARGDVAEALRLLRSQEQVARHGGNVGALQSILGNIGAVLLQQGDLDGAMTVLVEQEAVSRSAGLSTGIAQAKGNQGLVRFNRGDLAGAAADFAEQEQIATATGDDDALQTCLGNQAALAVQRNDAASALALMRRQAAICRTRGFWPALQKCAGFIAEITSQQGDLAGALAAVADVADAAARQGDEAARLQAVANQAVLLMNLGRFDEALTAYEDVAAGSVDPQARQLALEQQALILMQRQDWHRMLAVLAEQESVVRSTGDQNALQSCLGNRAIARRYTGDLAGAVADVEEQARICTDTGNQQSLVIATANLGELLCNVPGRREEGFAALARAEDLARRVGAAQMAQQIAQLAQQLRAAPN